MSLKWFLIASGGIVNKTFVLLILALVAVDPAFAGPGGKIASSLFSGFWGKLALVVLAIVLLPLIIWTTVQRYLSERRARSDLGYVAAHDSAFDWLRIQARAKECFLRVHSSWEKEDLSDVSAWMTEWYWQNQQMLFLERWKREGLQNVCEIKKIRSIRPLLFVHRNQGADHQESAVAIAIEAEMIDYLKKRSTGEVVEGNKEVKNVETIWTFTFSDGRWRVADIDDGGMAQAIMKIRHELPPIESTVGAKSRA